MLRYLQDKRLDGAPEATKAGLITAEDVAKELDGMLRDGVKQYGG
jgi:hypothetical protein